MSGAVWNGLRQARYAMPNLAGKIVPAKSAQSAAHTAAKLGSRGLAVTCGHFPGDGQTADEVFAANLAMIGAVAGSATDFYLSVKAPQLGFSRDLALALADAAASQRRSVCFDAHAPAQADRTFELFDRVLDHVPGTGCVLPARWRRSVRDADRIASTSARIRLVKGEWSEEGDTHRAVCADAYLDLAARLAGRRGVVSIATHDPQLAGQALSLLKTAGTPCELEQLLGLPMRRSMAAARVLDVPIRVYVPFGAGWAPYAVDRALARPYLPLWMLRDWLGMA